MKFLKGNIICYSKSEYGYVISNSFSEYLVRWNLGLQAPQTENEYWIDKWTMIYTDIFT